MNRTATSPTTVATAVLANHRSLRSLLLPCWWSLWLLLIASTGISYCNAAYIVNVPAKDEECFFVTSPKLAGTFYGNYELIDDGSGDAADYSPSLPRSADAVSLAILDAKTSRILYRSRRGSNEGNFKIEATPGQKLSLCVQNGIFHAGRRKPGQTREHDGKERTVGLQFSFEEKNPHLELHSQNGKLVSASRNLIRELSRLRDHYGYMKAREAKHRETVEGTFSKLMNWTLLQGTVVVLVAVGQIMYFRRFLEQRRYI